MDYHFLLDIALILISTKIFGMITRKFQMPQVVGALIAGLVFGPAVLGWLQQTQFIKDLAQLGVIVIMFSAGMGTDIRDLKKSGKAGFLVAVCGVIVPLLGGTALGFLFNGGKEVLLENVFIGVILTATSVSITVETLREIGKLSTKVGNTILAAAIIDDILGLVALTIVTSLGGANVNIGLVLLKIALFFVFVTAVYFAGIWLFNRYIKYNQKNFGTKGLHRYPVMAFVLCLLMAWLAEEIFGVADIIGAFAAGLIIAGTTKADYIASKFQPVQYLFLTPVFFASIGIKVELPEMSMMLLWISIAIVLVAILSKLVGCGLGAKLCGFSNRESIQTGFGMACRGEVALIVANKGTDMGMMPDIFFGPVIIMVVCCAVFTPILLKAVFKPGKKEDAYAQLEASALLDRLENQDNLEMINDQLLNAEQQIQEEAEEKNKE